MRHHIGFAGFVLLVIVGVAAGQQASNTPGKTRPAARSSYDPMPRGQNRDAPKGIVESTLAGINPRDKDYGQAVEDWRKEVFENTLDRVYFWGLILLGMSLGASLAGNGWLVRERERRFAISADIVTQLYNAYIGSRAKTLEVITKYNRLVERYNGLDGERQQLADQIAGDSGKHEQPELDFNQAREDRGAAAVIRPATTSDALESAPDGEAEFAKAETLKAQLAEVEVKLQRKTAQLQAKDNQITNLRERLSRAHDNLEGKRKGKEQAV
jgi:hypothetical protein